MAKRKTIQVKTMLDTVNLKLKTGTCNPDVRKGMCCIIEDILHMTDNYNGFYYLEQHEVPMTHRAGIIRDKTGENDHQFPDDTRRQYCG